MHYLERLIPLQHSPVAVAAALSATSECDHVAYEEPDQLSFAEDPLWDFAFSDAGEVARISEKLSEVDVAEWRAYGWAKFELAVTPRGGMPTDDALLRLMIPRREVRIRDGIARLRGVTEDDLHRLEERLIPLEPREPVGWHQMEPILNGDSTEGYKAVVAKGVEAIRAGVFDKVILSRVVEVPFEVDLARTYLAGRAGNTPARSFLLSLGGWEATGFSPEIVTRVTPSGEVTAQPLAGTRAFGADEQLNQRNREELYRDHKEVFEHAISVRLAAEELLTVCAPSSVTVDEFMNVRERGSVQHLASRLSGLLATGGSEWGAFAALFPAITASGIPKRAACDFIRRSEPARGLYSGAVLALGFDGELDAALVLRSVFRHGGRTWLRAGAGVVGESTPARELEETCEKLRSVSRYLVEHRPHDLAGHGRLEARHAEKA
ncbi:salicylate synthase [Amycolatopsis japonica]|uniref:salicylate synthase n=1 Tax=Amycolatopsis japonica TaxID=208439 RepID=UPI0036705F54